MRRISAPDLGTLSGIVMTAGLSVLASALQGGFALGFGSLAVVVGAVILLSLSVGWPLPALADDDLTRLRRKAVRLANRAKDATDVGCKQPRYFMPSAYDVTVTYAKSIRERGKVYRHRRFTRWHWRQLRWVLEELARRGRRDDLLRPWLTNRPTSDDLYDVSVRLYRLASVEP